jgi:hypothetical protein
VILLEHLRAALASHPFADRLARNRSTYLPFFESYFLEFYRRRAAHLPRSDGWHGAAVDGIFRSMDRSRPVGG